MKTTILATASLATLAGCSVAARSPDMYRDDDRVNHAQPPRGWRIV